MRSYSAACAFLAILSASPADAGKLRRRLQMYTLSDLAGHNTASSCWLGIDDVVWDVTTYAPTHLGGEAALLKRCGEELTADFYKVPSHAIPNILMNSLIIQKGALMAAPPKEVMLSDLASHNSEASCWLGIDGKVWDVTEYAPLHPVGADKVIARCGEEITEDFYKVANHLPMLLQNALIIEKGLLVADPITAAPVPATAAPVPATTAPVPSATAAPVPATTAPVVPATTVAPVPAAVIPPPVPVATAAPVPAATAAPVPVVTVAPIPAVTIITAAPVPAVVPVVDDTMCNGQPRVTTSEVAASNACIMIIYDKVFDLTMYAPVHPGGIRYITDNCNRDATKEYNDKHNEGMLRDVSGLQVGILKGGSDDTCGSNPVAGGGGGGTTPIVVVGTNPPTIYMGDDDDDDGSDDSSDDKSDDSSDEDD